MVPAADASHQPSSRLGIVAALPAEATGSTKANMAAVDPEAAFGPPIPAKKIANVTGTVTSAASQVVPLTRVPMISTTLPARASPRCAANLSRLVPPNPAMTSVANPPNVANSAICGSPTTLSVIAKRAGMTTVARAARIAAGTDQTGFHQGCAMGKSLGKGRGQQPVL